MKTMKAAALILDFEIYPRNDVDAHNVRSLCEALAAGVELPPVIVEKKSKRVVDGFHRVKAALRCGGEGAEVLVIEKTFRTEADLFLESIRLNAAHGVRLGSVDRTRCMIVAERLSIPPEAVAGALSVSVDKLAQLTVSSTARTAGGLMVPLKNTVRRGFAGKRLNRRQIEANEKLSGMNQVFYANQLIELIESEMLDTSDERLLGRLRVLHEHLDRVLAVV